MLVSVLGTAQPIKNSGTGRYMLVMPQDRMPIGWVFRDYINCRPDRGTATHAETFHYWCKSGDFRYALTVNTRPGHRHAGRAQGRPTRSQHSEWKVATFDVCGKYGWILNGARLLPPRKESELSTGTELEFDCDQADTE